MMLNNQPRGRDWGETLWVTLAPVLARVTLGLVMAVAAMWCFVELAEGVTAEVTQGLDAAVLRFLYEHRWSLLFQTMTWVSWAANGVAQTTLVLAVLAGLLVRKRPWPDVLTLLLAVGGGLGVIMGLKRLFHRARPEEIFSNLGYSFPSGHSFFAVVIYGLIGYWLSRDASPRCKRWIWTGVSVTVLLVGFSRMYVGEHFPTDVAAGYAVGVAWLWGCLSLPQAFHQRGRHLTPEERRAQYAELSAQLREAALFVPNLVRLATGLARDRRVPLDRKVGLAVLAAYLALPFDLIPDFIPVLGVADDLMLVNVVLVWVVKAVPREVLVEHWHGDSDLFELLGRVQEVIRRFWRGG